jgi:hypothetical protein
MGAPCESGQIQLRPDQVVHVVGLMEASADLASLDHGYDVSDHVCDSFYGSNVSSMRGDEQVRFVRFFQKKLLTAFDCSEHQLFFFEINDWSFVLLDMSKTRQRLTQAECSPTACHLWLQKDGRYCKVK